MGFIDTSDAEYLPVFYNVYHSVGTHGASRSVIQSLGRNGSGHAVSQSLGRDDSGRSVIQSLGRDGTNRSVIQSLGRDDSENGASAAAWLSCPNQPDDVKLVQYLLKAFYDFQPPHVRPKGEMKIDGFCGPVTNRWILQFQRDCNLAGGEQVLLMDNRVDRVLNKNLIGGISGKMYTLAMLNINVKYYSPDAWAKTPLFVPLQNPYGIQISYQGIVTASQAA